MKSVVIAEKPSVGRDIARVLGCSKGGNGFLEGKDYVVTWALGHLVELSDPESYGEQWKTWKMETLPMMPEKLEIQVIKKTGKQFQTVKAQMYRKDVGEIIIATDAGREGELVARWIIQKAGVRKPMKRLWISSVTDKAIRQGFAQLKDAREYQKLYEAAVARAEADWLVGLNATRALTVKHNAQLSCGRVQTPTLAIIAKREAQIRGFQSQPYYSLKVKGSGIWFRWRSGSNGTTTSSREEISRISDKVRNSAGTVEDVKKKQQKAYAPLLYDLTSLQQDANRLFGFSAKQTLDYMQRLYEHYKVVTYPRTDSRYLTQDIVETLPERVKACRGGIYGQVCTKLLKSSIKGNKSFVDDRKVSDHHAIIPTEQGISLSELEYGERKIYELVISRFLAVLLPPCEYEQTEVTVGCAGEYFTVKGKRIRQPGWQEIRNLQKEEGAFWDETEDEALPGNGISREEILDQMPEFVKGQKILFGEGKISEGKTKPPQPFTEATLLAAMENPVKYMESADKSLRKTLGETGGLGTVATRADIIEKLFNSFMLEKKDQYIHLTSKGRQVLELAPQGLTSPELTAKWEQQLSDIASGKARKKDFEAEIRSYTADIVKDIAASSKTYRHDNLTGKKCPECGKLMLEVNHKNGRMLVCQDRECGYRKTLSKVTNARCPQCHKKMELVGEGEQRRFTCGCGYREKLSAFEKRKKESGKGVSKKDVSRYMNKMRQEAKEPVNNAFADALAKIKL
ncbi:DNA topoisomerase III [Petralouisia muris]|uniref:DNA topoisomerase III n=1 Tax=Petralouisia muris TaxID=3032872 RepID=A0AC61RWD2_9FIRM|nr:DNA topoisomerase III [Petralouisia muris]TGY95991.1 DNA topoisomerase III [Petralouisia muris]